MKSLSAKMGLASAFAYSLFTNIAFAQSDGSEVAGGIIGILMLLCWCIFIVLILGLFVWTIMMIVDVAKRKDYKDQTLWLVLLIVGLLTGLYFIITPIYYFAVKKQLD